MNDTARSGGSNPDEGPFVSIIIPAYNEEMRLADSLEQVIAYYDAQDFSYEAIVVDDGSSDRTPDIVREATQEFQHLRLVQATHGGKGHACRQGVQASWGEWLFLCDSDLSMPIEEFAKFVPLLRDDQHIVIASREADGARRFGEPFYRHLMGRVFNAMVRLLAVRGVRDTQCGFKCFRSDVARDVFSSQTIDGWGFDVELLFIAQKRGYGITEVPIDWHYRAHSKIQPVQDTLNMSREIWRVRVNGRQGLYDRPE